MKSRTLFLIMCLFFCTALFMSSCHRGEESLVYEYVCGDGVCSAEELGKCDLDCDMQVEAEPVIKTGVEVLKELRSMQDDYPDYVSGSSSEGSSAQENQTNHVVEADTRIYQESFTSYVPETGFVIGAWHNLLGIGEDISDIGFELNKYQLIEVLRSGRLSSNTEAFGPRAAFYEQFIRLESGRVVFGYDEESETISTYLLYEEEEPILNYIFELSGGIFKFFEGESIHFLGHDYYIEAVGSDYIRLTGVTTPDTLLLRNASSTRINTETISSAQLNTTLEEDYLRIILKAQEDIKILAGSTLRQNLDRPEALLTNRLDIAYQGLTQAPLFNILFDKKSDCYKLSFTTNKNLTYKIPLLGFEPFRLGDDEHKLVLQEGDGTDNYVIGEKDYFVINNNRELNGLSTVLRLISINANDNILLFEDPALEKFAVYFEGTPGVNASAELIVDNVLHQVFVGEHGISADLDGDGDINNDKVSIITAGNGIIRFNELAKDYAEFLLVTPGEMREGAGSELETSLILRDEGISINRNDLKMFRHEGSENMVGMTDYGALFILGDMIDSEEQSGEDLLIRYPLIQRFAYVQVKVYE